MLFVKTILRKLKVLNSVVCQNNIKLVFKSQENIVCQNNIFK